MCLWGSDKECPWHPPAAFYDYRNLTLLCRFPAWEAGLWNNCRRIMRVIPIIALLATIVIGCSTTSSRSVGTSGFPQTGTHSVYAPDNRLLQKSVWRHGKLVTAWQYEQLWELPLEIIDAIHRGERDYPPPRWVQTVTNGKGRIHTFDERGEVMGFEDYLHGHCYGGAH